MIHAYKIYLFLNNLYNYKYTYQTDQGYFMYTRANNVVVGSSAKMALMSHERTAGSCMNFFYYTDGIETFLLCSLKNFIEYFLFLLANNANGLRVTLKVEESFTASLWEVHGYTENM